MSREQAYNTTITPQDRVCPWQRVRLFDNFLRTLLHNPERLFAPYVRPGMTVMDLGCGAGFASIGLAKLVGQKGLVISADLQPEMLDMVSERAQRSGLSDRIRIHQCQPDRIGIYEQLDFVVAFWMVHEVPDREGLAKEIHAVLRPEGRFFVAEPKMHVSQEDFERTIREAENTGFAVLERPCVRFSRTAVLSRVA